MDRIKGWLARLFWGVAGNALWTGIAGGGLMATATAILAAIAAKTKLISPIWVERALWALAGVLLIGIVTAFFSLFRLAARARARRPDVLIPLPNARTASQWTALQGQMDEVASQKFEQGELLIDGTHFRNCTFTSMRLYYDGTAPMAFTECEFDEETRRSIRSHSPLIAQWMEILRSLNWLREGAKLATTPLEDAKRAVQTPTALPPQLSAALGLDALPPRRSELTRIVGKTFERQTVLLDSFEYIGCKFADVKFVFNGGLYGMQDCTVDRSFSLQTANIVVLNTLALASILDFFKPEMAKAYEQIAVKAK
jgi:hypothetical protein